MLAFYSFLLCFFYPAFFTNGLRGSILPCLYVAGSPDYYVDPLAGHPSLNPWFRFQCNGKGGEANAYWLTFYMSLIILCLHCFVVPVAGVMWLCCNHHHIVHYHVEQFLGDGDVLQLPSVHVKEPPGSVLALKYMFEHFERGSFILRVFGYFGELLHRVVVAFFTIYYHNDHRGALYASLLVVLHMIFVVTRRPYNRTDVYFASCLADGSTVLVLVSTVLYQHALIFSGTIDLIFFSTTAIGIVSTIFLHLVRQLTVVKRGMERERTSVGGPKHRSTGSAWGRRYQQGDGGDSGDSGGGSGGGGGGGGDRDHQRRKSTDEVLPFRSGEEADDVPLGGQGLLFDESSTFAAPAMMISPPKMSHSRQQRGVPTAPPSSTTRLEKDIRFKLQAWWYRYSFVQRWHDSFRKEHHKIPSRVDQAKDPDLTRNQQRLDQRTQELRKLGVSDPAAAFRERNLKPKQDNRLVMVPKASTSDGFDMIKKEKNFLSEKSNFGLRLEKGADDLNSYDNVLGGSAPGSSKKIKARTKKNRRLEEEIMDEEERDRMGMIPVNGQHRLHRLPRRSIYAQFNEEEKAAAQADARPGHPELVGRLSGYMPS